MNELNKELVKQAGWISVTESLPNNITPVLVFGVCCGMCLNIKIAEIEDNNWFESGIGENLHFKVLYWQHLPYPFKDLIF